MASEWRECVWGDIATLEYGKSLRGYRETEGPYCVYGTNGPIGWHDQPLCSHPGVIVGRKGAYRGIHYSPDPFFVIDTAFYLQPNEEMDLRWAYYCLLTYDINGMDSGSAIPSTSRESFYYLPVRVPPLPEQRAIAYILGALDDKIELNRRMNETLEAMARAIFKSWFVDFDPVRAKAEGRQPHGLAPHIADLFPDAFEESELGEIPKGWQMGTLLDIAEINAKSWTARNHPEEVEYVDLSNTKWGVIESTALLPWEKAPSRARRVACVGDTIVATTRPGSGSYTFISQDGLTVSTGFAVLTPKKRRYQNLMYITATNPNNINRLANLADAHGGAYPGVKPSEVSDTEIMLPSNEEIIEAFETITSPIRERIELSKQEARTLAALRDTLLPRLISGELRVPDAERIVGRCGI